MHEYCASANFKMIFCYIFYINLLTAFSCHERNGRTWRTFVLGVENADLCRDVGEWPQVVNMTGVDVSLLTRQLTVGRRPARSWLTVDYTVFFHCLQAFSRLPELNLHHTTHHFNYSTVFATHCSLHDNASHVDRRLFVVLHSHV